MDSALLDTAKEYRVPKPVRNKPPPPNAVGVLLVKASELINVVHARNEFGVNGAGTTVAVLDSGINPKHKAFEGRIQAQRNFTGPDNPNDNATDCHGHGSNVSGIVVGATVPGILHAGMAPGAKIVSVKVLNDEGKGEVNQDKDSVTLGLQWVFENAEQHNISAVCLSLGGQKNFIEDTESWMTETRKLIQQLTAKKIVVCIAAGNDFFTHKSKEGHAFPAIIRECVSVGAVYDDNAGPFAYENGATTKACKPDEITPFSQRLSKEVGKNCFTTIFAPGAPVTSAGPVETEDTTTDHGTSQATPVVCGVVLLIQELYKRYHLGQLPTVEDVKNLLRTGVTIVDGDNPNDNVKHTGKSYIRVDAIKALSALPKPLIKGKVQKSTVSNLFEVVDEITKIAYTCYSTLRAAEAAIPLDLLLCVGAIITVEYNERDGTTLYGAKSQLDN